MRSESTICGLVLAALAVAGCWDLDLPKPRHYPDAAVDMDADMDTDMDADADTDSDADSDTDAYCDPGWAGASCEICVRFVSYGATADGDGLTWSTAFDTIREGVESAAGAAETETVCEVWVSQAWYFVFETGPEDTVYLPAAVHLYGGFGSFGEYLREQRDFVNNETVISGTDPDFTQSVYHVLTAEADGIAGGVIDGFTVSGGSAEGADVNGQGGGLLNYQETLQVRNCIFDGNGATVGGGAVLNLQANPSFERTIFRHNYSEGSGGAIWNHGGQPHIENTVFWNNLASGGNGGAIHNYSDTGDSPASPIVVNCTFQANSPHAIFNEGESLPNIRNSIFWQNGEPEILNQGGAGAQVEYCLVEDGYDGGVTVDGDPDFADAGAGDFHLDSASSCIDAADGNAAPETDFEGVARHDVTWIEDTGVGDITYVDIGAFEFVE